MSCQFCFHDLTHPHLLSLYLSQWNRSQIWTWHQINRFYYDFELATALYWKIGCIRYLNECSFYSPLITTQTQILVFSNTNGIKIYTDLCRPTYRFAVNDLMMYVKMNWNWIFTNLPWCQRQKRFHEGKIVTGVNEIRNWTVIVGSQVIKTFLWWTMYSRMERFIYLTNKYSCVVFLKDALNPNQTWIIKIILNDFVH